MRQDADVIIVGGGIVGSILACALGRWCGELNVTVIEARRRRAGDDEDGRGLALALTSVEALATLGVWREIARHANPIKRVHVSDQRRFARVRMDAASLNLPALGYVTPAAALARVLARKLASLGSVTMLSPATVTAVEPSEESVGVTLNHDGAEERLSGRLLIATDGAESDTRALLGIETTARAYRQTAIVSRVTPYLPHADAAYERFTEHGPLALLPLPQRRCVAVFTVPEDQAPHYLQMDDEDFLACLLRHFGRRLGHFIGAGRRQAYALKQVWSREQIRRRAVVLGDAAHRLHPNAAQGLNLSLRDALALAMTLHRAQQDGQDLGAPSVLHAYLRSRLADQRRVRRFTDDLADNFYTGQRHRVVARGLAMMTLDSLPWLKRHFIRHLMGGAIPLPEIR